MGNFFKKSFALLTLILIIACGGTPPVPPPQVDTVTVTDTVITTDTVPVFVIDTVVETVIEVDTLLIIDTVEVVRVDTVEVPTGEIDTVEVVRVDTVEVVRVDTVIVTRVDTVYVDTTTPPPPPVTLTSIIVSPASANLLVGSTQQFSVAGRNSDGSTATGPILVTWAASAGIINNSGLYTATTAGNHRVIATQQNGTLADTSTVTVTDTTTPPPPPPGGAANPLALPQVTGNGTAPGTQPTVAIGGGYKDPLSNVQVWRVSAGHHDYGNGPTQISAAFGSPERHTVVVADGGYQLIDVVRGQGITNRRRLVIQPSSDLCTTFSNVNPQIVYVVSGGTLYRINATTNLREDAPGFPKAGMGSGPCWLMNSADDKWFTTTSGGSARAYNVDANTITTTAKGGEAYLDRRGRYVVLPNEGGATSQIWDALLNTKTNVTLPGSHFNHGHTAYGTAGTFNVDAGGGVMAFYTVDIATSTASQTWTYPGYSPDYHTAGQWVQPNMGLNQWVLMSPMRERFANPGPCRKALCLFRLNGVDGVRHIAYHYSNVGGDGYWTMPRGTISPDGRMVMWSGDGQGGVNSVFVAEVP